MKNKILYNNLTRTTASLLLKRNNKLSSFLKTNKLFFGAKAKLTNTKKIEEEKTKQIKISQMSKLKYPNNPEVLDKESLINNIRESNFIGNVDEDSLVLHPHNIMIIENHLENDYYSVFESESKSNKIFIYKILLILGGVALFSIFVYSNKFIISKIAKFPFLTASATMVLLALFHKKFNISNKISKIALHKSLNKIKIEYGHNGVIEVPNQDVFYNFNRQEVYEHYKKNPIVDILVNQKNYYINLEEVKVFDKDLLSLIIRGYNFKV